MKTVLSPPFVSVPRPVGEVYEAYLSRFDMALSGAAPLTRRSYLASARRFLHFLGARMGLEGLPLDSICREHAREWLRALERDGLAPASIHTLYAGARQFFKLMEEDGEVRENPFQGLKTPAAPMKEVKILSPEEVQAMIDAAKRDHSVWGARDRAIIFCLYDGGFRRAELLGIREADIDVRMGTILVTGKGARERRVPLSPNAFRGLMQYLTARRKWIASQRWYRRPALEEASIWLSHHGDALKDQGLAQLLKRRAREGGVTKPVHPHLLRHSAATAQAGEHIPEEELRAKMGWSPGSQQVYRYTRTSLAERAVEGHRRYGPANRLRL